MTPVYSGSCHCGAVTFRVEAEIVELTTCDCSLCTKKNARMTQVAGPALTITSGEDALTLYQWNTKVAKHWFCSKCGIYTFHRKRSAPGSWGVNIFCLDDLDSAAVPVRRAEGRGMSVTAEGARLQWPGPREG